MLLDFGDRTRTGVFNMVWSLTIVVQLILLHLPQNMNHDLNLCLWIQLAKTPIKLSFTQTTIILPPPHRHKENAVKFLKFV
jgi:hypothetical protein